MSRLLDWLQQKEQPISPVDTLVRRQLRDRAERLAYRHRRTSIELLSKTPMGAATDKTPNSPARYEACLERAYEHAVMAEHFRAEARAYGAIIGDD